MIETLGFSFLASYLPKVLLIVLVLAYLITRVLQTRPETLGKARTLALAGLALLLFGSLAAPLAYAVLASAGGPSMIAWGYALTGGVFTVLDAAGVLLLGLAVLAGRAPR